MRADIKERIDKINCGEVPEGYKKTKVGIMPEDWNEILLGDIINYKKGFAFKSSNYTSEGVRIIRISDTTYESIKDDEPIYLDVCDRINYNEYELNEGDLMISTVGSRPPMYDSMVGKVIRIPKSIEGSLLNQNAVRLRTNSIYNQDFIYYNLKTQTYLFYIEKNVRGNANQVSITLEDLFRFKIVSPKKEEQQKIASIISTWDKAIELKEKLIQQNKEQKKGLMQNLLTGKVRLKGFDGEWKYVKIGAVLKDRNETGYNELELLAITSRNGVVKRTEIDIKDNSSEDKSKYKRICRLDIGYNTMRMWQGVSGVSEYEGIVSPAYTILTPTEKMDSYFVGYLFKLPTVINLFSRYSQGMVSDTLNLKYSNLKQIKVKIPSDRNEQIAIAKILKTIDRSIEFTQNELETLKQQKKGLMQLLLTGKVRVKC